MNQWMKGKYVPKNINKYKGDVTKITYRSSWERTFMVWCDTTPEVLAWSSETVIIPYWDPVQKKERNYFMDFRIVTKSSDGTPKVSLIEIKPFKQTQKPRANRNKSDKTLITETQQWMTNKAKWQAAERFCKALGWTFHIFTERDLYGDMDRAEPRRAVGGRKKAG